MSTLYFNVFSSFSIDHTYTLKYHTLMKVKTFKIPPKLDEAFAEDCESRLISQSDLIRALMVYWLQGDNVGEILSTYAQYRKEYD